MDKDTKSIIILASILIIVIFGLIWLGKYTMDNKQKIVTLDEKVTETLDGEETEENFVYNGFVFVKVGNLWHTEYQRNGNLFQIPLHFNPKQVENISILGELNIEKFNAANDFYITFDPTQPKLGHVALSAAELSLNMAMAMKIFPQAACTLNETEGCVNRPIITCDNTEESVILLKNEEPAQITLKDNCIIIQGTMENLVRSTDRLIYQWYGIMS